MPDVVVRIGADLKEFDAGGKELERALGDIGKSVGGFGGTLGKVVSGPLTGLLESLGRLSFAASGAKVLAQGIASVATGMVAGNAEMETYETQLGTLMGSADKAKTRLADLAKFGAETPFELPEIVRAEKVLLGFGLAGEKAMKLTGKSADGLRTIIGDIAAGTGAQFEEIALNFGKFSAGATGEAISRLQEMGVVTREQLSEMGIRFSGAGELMSPLPEAMAAAVKIAEAKFGGGMAKLSKTFGGQMSTLADNFNQAKNAITAPIFEVLRDSLASVNEFLSSGFFQDALQNVARILAGAVAQGVDLAVHGFQTLRETASSAWELVRMLATGDFQGGIFGLSEDHPLISGLLALRWTLSDLITTGGDIGVLADNLREAFGIDIGALVEPIQAFVDTATANLWAFRFLIEGLVRAVGALLSGDFAGAWSTAKDAVLNYVETIWQNLQAFVGRLVPVLTGWAAAFLDWIGPVIADLPKRLLELKDAIWAFVTDWAPRLLAQLGEWKDAFLGWIAPTVSALPGRLGAIRDEALNWITTTAPRLLARLGEWGASFVNWVQPQVDPLLTALGGLKDAAMAWVSAQAQPILDQLGTWGASFVAWIGPATDKFLAEWPANLTRFLDWIEDTAAPQIVSTLSSWISAFVDWIGGEGDGKATGGMLTALGNIANALWRFIEGTAAVLGPRLAKWGTAFLNWVGEKVIPELPGILWSIVTKIAELVAEIAPRIFEVAKSLGLALARGIIAGLPAPEALKNAILGFLGGTPAAATPIVNVGPTSGPWARPPTSGGGGVKAWVNGVEIPEGATGGLISSSGLAMVHAGEIIGPLEAVRGMVAGGTGGIDYDRLARAMARVRLSVGVDDVHGALLRKQRRNVSLGLA